MNKLFILCLASTITFQLQCMNEEKQSLLPKQSLSSKKYVTYKRNIAGKEVSLGEAIQSKVIQLVVLKSSQKTMLQERKKAYIYHCPYLRELDLSEIRGVDTLEGIEEVINKEKEGIIVNKKAPLSVILSRQPSITKYVPLISLHVLTSLNLSKCGLTQIPRDIQQLTQLTEFIADGNEITFDGDADEFRNMHSLIYLSLKDNGIENMPRIIFSPLTRTRTIFFQDNGLEEFSCYIEGLKELISVYLGGNPLTQQERANLQTRFPMLMD